MSLRSPTSLGSLFANRRVDSIAVQFQDRIVEVIRLTALHNSAPSLSGQAEVHNRYTLQPDRYAEDSYRWLRRSE